MTEQEKKERRIKIGQKIIAGFGQSYLTDEFKALIKEKKIGNVILFQSNIESTSQLKKLTSDLRKLIVEETGILPLIAIDQEGGVVTRLPLEAINVPGAMALTAVQGQEDAIFRCSEITAKEMLSYGCNLNFAPDCDVINNPQNRVIGVRSYSNDPTIVAQNSTKAIAGYLKHNLVCCAKHFPGHGDTSVDSHVGLPVIDKDLEELEKVELVPFRAAVKAGVPSIMTSHIVFPKLDDSGLPATMNKKILSGILREKIGFDGVIFTDCLEMGAIQGKWGTVQGALKAFEASADIAGISHTPSLAAQVSDCAFELLDDEILDASFNRIMALKKRFLSDNAQDDSFYKYDSEERLNDETFVNDIRSKSLTLVHPLKSLGPKPLFIGCYPFVVTMVSNPENKSFCFSAEMKSLLGGESIITSTDPTEEEIKSVCSNCKGFSSVTVGTYNGHSKPGQIALVKELEKVHNAVNVVALRNPFDLSSVQLSTGALAAYEYTPMIMKPIADVLSGKAKPYGVLPVEL